MTAAAFANTEFRSCLQKSRSSSSCEQGEEQVPKEAVAVLRELSLTLPLQSRMFAFRAVFPRADLYTPL